MPLQIVLAAGIYSCGTNHEIVIYRKCRVVTSIQLGTSSLRIKCERKGFLLNSASIYRLLECAVDRFSLANIYYIHSFCNVLPQGMGISYGRTVSFNTFEWVNTPV